MPAHPAGAIQGGETQVPHPETSGSKPGNEGLEVPTVPTNLPPDVATAKPPVQDAGPDVPFTNAPQRSVFQDYQVFGSGHRYNSVYQRETGHIFADPFGAGDGELANLLDGRIVNLRREWEKENKEREERDGGMDRSGERAAKGLGDLRGWE